MSRDRSCCATGRRRLTSVRVAPLGVAPLLLLAAMAASAETRGYVISWFATATNTPEFPINCPRAYQDPKSRASIGYIVNGAPLRVDRAVVNGKPVAPLNYPDAVLKDPDIETVSGPHAYGFDLGGPQANKFTDPETHQKVDDQLWRAVGCTTSFQSTPPAMPYIEGQAWQSGYADAAPAWAMQISGTDLNKDGPVTVTLDRTLDHLLPDALGGARSGVTFVIDPSPRSHNELTGEITNGVLWIKSGSIFLEGSLPYYLQVDLADVHMRLRSEAGGKLVGYWGGYTDWHKWIYTYTSRCGGGVDCIGMYRAMEKLADYDPDPVTGRNRKISITYRMEAVPAFLAMADGRGIAVSSTQGLGGQVAAKVVSNGSSDTAASSAH